MVCQLSHSLSLSLSLSFSLPSPSLCPLLYKVSQKPEQLQSLPLLALRSHHPAVPRYVNSLSLPLSHSPCLGIPCPNTCPIKTCLACAPLNEAPVTAPVPGAFSSSSFSNSAATCSTLESDPRVKSCSFVRTTTCLMRPARQHSLACFSGKLKAVAACRSIGDFRFAKRRIRSSAASSVSTSCHTHTTSSTLDCVRVNVS